MKIKKLTFINHKTGWNIKDAQFANTTLFVGASGVGKTQILRALQMLSHIALGHSSEGIEWEISFSQNGRDYRWQGEFGLIDSQASFGLEGRGVYPVIKECLVEGKSILIQRDIAGLKYRGEETVRLDKSRSAIDLLKEEDGLDSVVEAFRQVYELDDEPRFMIPFKTSDTILTEPQTLDNIKIRRKEPSIYNLYLLKKNCPSEFETISEAFMSIFPLVENIDFTVECHDDTYLIPNLHIREKGVSSPISFRKMSSGMRKTLSQITALTLAKDGDVILIDEFENGLGVNCIDLLADLVRNPDADVQMIITSHHPYIINTIPTSQWKVVTRNGSDVSIHNASELNIGTHSHHDAFMQLLQTNAYKTGQL